MLTERRTACRKHLNSTHVHLIALSLLSGADGYMAFTNLDYGVCAPDLPGLGGAVNPCRNLICCKQECDNDPSCGVYMFGTANGCVDCCWSKTAPTCSNMVPFLGATTYVKTASE